MKKFFALIAMFIVLNLCAQGVVFAQSTIDPSQIIKTRQYAELDMTSFTVPDGIKLIQPNAFLVCEKLKEIHIPPSVERIEEYAFNFCPALADIYFYGDKIELFDANNWEGQDWGDLRKRITIHGHVGSDVEKWATKYALDFVAIVEPTTEPGTETEVVLGTAPFNWFIHDNTLQYNSKDSIPISTWQRATAFVVKYTTRPDGFDPFVSDPGNSSFFFADFVYKRGGIGDWHDIFKDDPLVTIDQGTSITLKLENMDKVYEVGRVGFAVYNEEAQSMVTEISLILAPYADVTCAGVYNIRTAPFDGNAIGKTIVGAVYKVVEMNATNEWACIVYDSIGSTGWVSMSAFKK